MTTPANPEGPEAGTLPEMPSVIPRRRLEQAPLPALEADGLGVVSVVTVLFAVASVVLLVAYDALQAAGRDWWLWVGVAGTALGFVGIAYCLRLRRRRKEPA